ncbi:hypothetical protein DIZ27_20435 [Streptomyces sp. NWU339]|uniref:hypothetical protein n=1 Tax=Streptomyces sp. NWU339 TaxID=2185284 RepID=UPI000D67FBB6|nr:hypothetical protein [Streptomyces sp. NWU339]PWI08822.1 hypothetical protein DIZ27_20435 [Streptomyces sp. NWU339]
MLHRILPAEVVIAGMTTVLKIGAVSTDLVAIEARKALENAEAEPEDGPADDPLDQDDGNRGGEDAAGDGAKVLSLHAKRLPPDLRPGLPDMSKYDRLLKPVTPTTSTATTPRKGTSA